MLGNRRNLHADHPPTSEIVSADHRASQTTTSRQIWQLPTYGYPSKLDRSLIRCVLKSAVSQPRELSTRLPLDSGSRDMSASVKTCDTADEIGCKNRRPPALQISPLTVSAQQAIDQ